MAQSASIRAILKGLKGRSEKGYYIHTSGAAIIWGKPNGPNLNPKIWDDVVDIKALTSMPEGALHMIEDKVLFTSQLVFFLAR